MQKDYGVFVKSDSYSIVVGGKAGEGVKKAAQVIAAILCAQGRNVVQYDDYQSLIRGGHNFSVVSSSSEQVFATYESFDLIICFDQASVDEHRAQLKEGGLLFFNSDSSLSETGTPLPMDTLLKRHYSVSTNVSLAATAVFCAVMRLPIEFMDSIISAQYKQNALENIAYSHAIYDLVDKHNDLLKLARSNEKYRYLSGNQVIGLGAWAAGLDFYFSYPMTPASSLLHYLATKQDSHKIYAVHAESELAAINMAIGAAVAGCRSAVGSSGGGFALMQEAFSLAGMVEAPLLCVLSSRPGPSTGVSTYTAQEDLWFALHQGHGEFPRVVASPDCYERAFSLAAELLSLAWQAQTPVILLTEKQLSEGMMKVDLDYQNLADAELPEAIATEDYQRYALTESGVSPLAFPGDQPGAVCKWNSNEHQAFGLRTDKAAEIVAMKDKRQRKGQFLSQATQAYQRVAEYGEGENLVFAYGSTVLELREALKHCSVPCKIIAPIYLEPFPIQELLPYRAKQAIVVEHSAGGMFADFLRQKLALDVVQTILKYDGRPWDPIALAKLLEEAFHA